MPQQAEDILNDLRHVGVIRDGVPARRLPGGTVNTSWQVMTADGSDAVLRVGPDRATVAAGPVWLRAGALACEAIVVDRVRDLLPAPATRSAGFRRRPWLLQELVPGRPLAEVLPNLDREAVMEIWQQIGTLLRRLHDTPGEWFGTPDGTERFPDWPAMVRADAEGMLADARRFGLDADPFARLLAEVESGRAALAEIERPAVVHSDLDPRHVFVQRRGDRWQIAGVIDWEYARYVDPWSESLLVAMLARPDAEPERASLLAGYGADPAELAEPAFRQRQAIYRRIAEGWARTDAARLQRAMSPMSPQAEAAQR